MANESKSEEFCMMRKHYSDNVETLTKHIEDISKQHVKEKEELHS